MLLIWRAVELAKAILSLFRKIIWHLINLLVHFSS
jgi:hypothetical protein